MSRDEMTLIVNAGTTADMPMRRCPECGQTGRGFRCHHYDIAGMRAIPTEPVNPTEGEDR